MIKIRKSTKADLKEILSLHSLAFGKDEGPVIAKLVKDLFEDETAKPILSLVAMEENSLIGHILYTKVTIRAAESPIPAHILAPLAVLPNRQKKGVGIKLIKEGLRLLKKSGTKLVFVLGHPGYYPRCGFIPATEQGFNAPYPIPEEHAAAWMVQELYADILQNNSGKVQCSKVLNAPEHWSE